jgi:hypothetical protein
MCGSEGWESKVVDVDNKTLSGRNDRDLEPNGIIIVRRGRLAPGNDDADDGLFVWIRKTRTGCWRGLASESAGGPAVCCSAVLAEKERRLEGSRSFVVSVTERLVG